MAELDAGARPGRTVGWLFVDDDGDVLLVEPVDRATWEIPGGQVERGEPPTEAGTRLRAEELGLELTPRGLLVVDRAPYVREERSGFLPYGGRLTDEQLDAIEPAPGRLENWAFLPPDELFVMMEPRLVRRATAACAAREAGRTGYLEHGAVPAPAPADQS